MMQTGGKRARRCACARARAFLRVCVSWSYSRSVICARGVMDFLDPGTSRANQFLDTGIVLRGPTAVIDGVGFLGHVGNVSQKNGTCRYTDVHHVPTLNGFRKCIPQWITWLCMKCTTAVALHRGPVVIEWSQCSFFAFQPQINSSLAVLKQCIRLQTSCNNNARKRSFSHVPYRESELTRLLKDSFTSPHACSALIATISPNGTDTEHTLDTLAHATTMASAESFVRTQDKVFLLLRIGRRRGHRG